MAHDLERLFAALWNDYIRLAPDAQAIHQLFARENNGQVINDHIALRTFNLLEVNLDTLARPFVQAGYQPRGEYQFPQRKLFARHFEPPHPELPKVFISELRVEQLSRHAQAIIKTLVAQVDKSAAEQAHFCYSGRAWSLNLEHYDRLLEESEYAAWVAAHGYHANHFTVSLNHFQQPVTLEQVNQKLIQAGFAMNDSGGLIKGSAAQLLEQSATLARPVTVTFSDGQREIPGCFYEFARRYPMADGRLYQGFVAASADRIFESTHTKKT